MTRLLPLLLLLAGCGGASAGTQAAACQDASAALVTRIVDLAPPGSGFTVQEAKGQKATKASTYWVGVRFTTKGGTASTGIWAVGGGLDGRGTLLAVSPVAQEFSSALDADTSASKIPDTDGTSVLACL